MIKENITLLADEAIPSYYYFGKHILFATNVFLIFFLALMFVCLTIMVIYTGSFSVKHELSFVLEFLGIIAIPVGVGYIWGIVTKLIHFFSQTIHEINFNTEEITKKKNCFFTPTTTFVANLKDIEIIAVSSRVEYRKFDHAFVPTVNMFLKDGQEIVLTAYHFHGFLRDLDPINVETKKMADRMNCKFYKGIFAHKTTRHVIEGEIFYQNELHERWFAELYSDQSHTSLTKLTDI